MFQMKMRGGTRVWSMTSSKNKNSPIELESGSGVYDGQMAIQLTINLV